MKTLVQWLKELDLTISMSEGRRIVVMGGVQLNGETIKDLDKDVVLKPGDTIQVGKRIAKTLTDKDLGCSGSK